MMIYVALKEIYIETWLAEKHKIMETQHSLLEIKLKFINPLAINRTPHLLSKLYKLFIRVKTKNCCKHWLQIKFYFALIVSLIIPLIT